MIKRFVLLILLCSASAGPCLAIAQDDAEAARQAAAQRAMEEARLARQQYEAELADRQRREQSIKDMNDFLRSVHDDITVAGDNAARQRERERRVWHERIQGAFEEFAAATTGLREALGLRAPLKNPAKGMGKNAEVFLDYLKVINEKRSRFDSSEFKGMKDAEIGSEALTTAERLVPRLEEVLYNDSESTINLKFLKSLPSIETELLRLQWMTRRLR